MDQWSWIQVPTLTVMPGLTLLDRLPRRRSSNVCTLIPLGHTHSAGLIFVHFHDVRLPRSQDIVGSLLHKVRA